jgi:hypothetical protein
MRTCIRRLNMIAGCVRKQKDMMTGGHKSGWAPGRVSGWTRRAALAAGMAFLLMPTAWSWPQRAARAAPAPRAQQRPSAPRNQKNQNRNNQQRPANQQNNQMNRPVQGYGQQPAVRPAYPGAAPNAVYPSGGQGQAYRPQVYPGAAPPGHLGAWLNEHRNVPLQDQERMLRTDPNFTRLPPGEQQRLVQQLHQVNTMPEQQRDRRLARAENLERLSPQERMQVNQSARRFTMLPADRQAVMKNAFRDLRSVPPEQRGMVLNSARYQSQFSPEERGMLSDMLKVEPYEAPR